MLTAYNVISSDGFIAGQDGSENFIPDEVWTDFLWLCTQHDALIIGKNTYDAIQSFGENLLAPFEDLKIKKVVVTRDNNFTPKTGYGKVSSLQEALALGSNILLCSGPGLNTAFLKEKLIDRIILNKLPVTIGTGIPQFTAGSSLKLVPLPELSIKRDGGRTLETYAVSYETDL